MLGRTKVQGHGEVGGREEFDMTQGETNVGWNQISGLQG